VVEDPLGVNCVAVVQHVGVGETVPSSWRSQSVVDFLFEAARKFAQSGVRQGSSKNQPWACREYAMLLS